MPHPSSVSMGSPGDSTNSSTGDDTGENNSLHWIQQLPAGNDRHFASGEMISRPDSGNNQVFLLKAGSARICLSGEQKELTLGWLKPGSIYVTHTRAWVEALSPCDISSWPIEQLHELISSRPQLALIALREVGMMLHQATNLIEDLAFRPVESRLARYLLLEHSDQNAADNNDIIQLTGHTELLASLLGTSRQTLSTLINRLIKEQVLARPDRLHLQLLNIPHLQQLSAS